METSYFNPPMGLNNILLRIKAKGYYPILAHPERYVYKYAKWPKGMQDTKGAANFIQTQFQEGKTAAIIDGPWKAASLKEAKVNYGVATIPTCLLYTSRCV